MHEGGALSHLLEGQDVKQTRGIFDLIELIGGEGFQSGRLGTKLAVWDHAEVEQRSERRKEE